MKWSRSEIMRDDQEKSTILFFMKIATVKPKALLWQCYNVHLTWRSEKYWSSWTLPGLPPQQNSWIFHEYLTMVNRTHNTYGVTTHDVYSDICLNEALEFGAIRLADTIHFHGYIAWVQYLTDWICKLTPNGIHTEKIVTNWKNIHAAEN